MSKLFSPPCNTSSNFFCTASTNACPLFISPFAYNSLFLLTASINAKTTISAPKCPYTVFTTLNPLWLFDLSNNLSCLLPA
ncbi:hypothetical protein OMAG_001221 [Candidatus Omnitrophus magneticus]|uniref:Uncharacterized protein n=1 Tax=Candidatus Omnitrophus magneticus TaxID=1609969 RepID=A0A0F0CSC3_9BACT|nr:hypothetical protein OMAG_001221 [Candidatus Omnitrophus magneticus]